jgi:hypothetical protein
MKKLMTLVFLGLAAFAGGGLMNEHNMTTFVNYLYHQQQVGNVINLGTIADSPPAALPETLPATPGAVTQAGATNPPATLPSTGAVPEAGHPTVPNSGGTTSGARTADPNRQGPERDAVAQATSVPGTAPPPLSITWPDDTVSTYRPGTRSAVTPPPPAPAAPSSEFELSNQRPIAALPPSAGTPTVPPPQMAPSPAPAAPSFRDDAVTNAAFAPATAENRNAADDFWKEFDSKMKSLGVVRFEITGTPGGKSKFRCELATPGAPPFEAEHHDLVLAAQAALKRVRLYNAARRASQNDPSVSAEPSAAAGFDAPSTAAVPPPQPPIGKRPAFVPGAPLTPPPDIPN